MAGRIIGILLVLIYKYAIVRAEYSVMDALGADASLPRMIMEFGTGFGDTRYFYKKDEGKRH